MRFGQQTETCENKYKLNYKVLSRIERSNLRKLKSNLCEFESYQLLHFLTTNDIFTIEMIKSRLDLKTDFVSRSLLDNFGLNTFSIGTAVKSRTLKILQQYELQMLTQEVNSCVRQLPNEVSSELKVSPIKVNIKLSEIQFYKVVLSKKVFTTDKYLLHLICNAFAIQVEDSLYRIQPEKAFRILTTGLQSRESIMEQKSFHHETQLYRYLKKEPAPFEKVVYIKNLESKRPALTRYFSEVI